MPHARAWGACLNMHEYPYVTEPGMFDRFLSASLSPHGVSRVSLPARRSTAQALATRKQNRMRRSGDRALDQAAELTQAANLIAGNRWRWASTRLP